MEIPFNLCFINNSKNTQNILDNLDYIKFTKQVFETDLCFGSIFNNNTINKDIIGQKQFIYQYYRYLLDSSIVIDLFWINRFNKSRKAKSNKNGTISNFVYMNSNELNYTPLEFGRMLKFVYLINSNDMLGYTINKQLGIFDPNLKRQIEEIVEISTLNTIVPNILNIIDNNE